MIDLNALSKFSLAVAEQRQKNGGNVKTDTHSMLKHCATEVDEDTDDGYDCEEWEEVGHE